ncbi:alkaline phosphatase family protein [Kitasatospora cheerisanensis]|uniref:alkaline phosphatase family protein n=1 Tax=Kitasatospora cheerisanensis TaxID=81942 RepID=UPI000A0181DD|nr:alkaline phosphatase family protein [Kitasatospora cheerisanensis]
MLVVADQLRADVLGCYGHPLARTPELDALARQGTRFDRHYSVCAPCGPARASLLTGRYQSAHGMLDNRTPVAAGTPTIAAHLTEAGTGCHVVGYTDTVAPQDGRETVPDGFSWHTRFNLSDAGLAEWLGHLAANGRPVPANPVDILRPAPGTRNLARYPARLSDTAFVADRTIACMTERQDEPWCIVATFLRPHPPWVAPAPYHAAYDPSLMASPHRLVSAAAEAERHPFLRYWLGRDCLDTAAADLTDEAVARHRATYLGLVAELDHHVGRLMSALRELGRERDTLVVFTADHGDTLGDHWSLGTGGFRETAYRIPLIVRHPGRPGGSVVTGPTESVDVTATVLDWAGVPQLPHGHGSPLLPPGAGAAGSRPAAVQEFDFRDGSTGRPERELGLRPEECRLTVVRTARHSYVHFPALDPLLFDREEDPGELRDLSRLPEFRRVLEYHAELLEKHERRASRPPGNRDRAARR